MATNANFPPYEYHEGGEIVGIDVEIAQAIAEKLDKELKIEDMEFGAIIDAVASGKADMGVAGMTVREDRLENANFSDPYTTATQVIIVQEGSDITEADHLADKSVGVQENTTATRSSPTTIPTRTYSVTRTARTPYRRSFRAKWTPSSSTTSPPRSLSLRTKGWQSLNPPTL